MGKNNRLSTRMTDGRIFIAIEGDRAKKLQQWYLFSWRIALITRFCSADTATASTCKGHKTPCLGWNTGEYSVRCEGEARRADMETE